MFFKAETKVLFQYQRGYQTLKSPADCDGFYYFWPCIVAFPEEAEKYYCTIWIQLGYKRNSPLQLKHASFGQ